MRVADGWVGEHVRISGHNEITETTVPTPRGLLPDLICGRITDFPVPSKYFVYKIDFWTKVLRCKHLACLTPSVRC
jgi:aspartate carbamoyltransferase regulatory subunit